MDIYQLFAAPGIIFCLGNLFVILFKRTYVENRVFAAASIFTGIGLYYVAFSKDSSLETLSLAALTIGILSYVYGWYKHFCRV